MIKLFVLLSGFILLGCGVKGDPVAPGVPVEIGRGKPTYKRAMQKIKINETRDEDDEESKNDDQE